MCSNFSDLYLEVRSQVFLLFFFLNVELEDENGVSSYNGNLANLVRELCPIHV